LLVCEVHRGAGIGDDLAGALRAAGEAGMHAQVLTFNGRDEALEFAEDQILDSLDCEHTQISDHVALADNSLARYMRPEDIEVLQAALRQRNVERGVTLFETGDDGEELFIVLRGEVEARITTTPHHYKRLATYGPGTFLGELALLKQGQRAARAVAVAPTELLVLSRDAFRQITIAHPATAIALLSAICDALVSNQRWSTREMQRLAEW
ncbi:MAG: cyclic nucleotide-binding domain-containing protein, partial [Gammaproteobacteria bacterium]|nr:cyclic nucleotide-binding domain-containing protein [Gammaproteobacteria bacterium]